MSAQPTGGRRRRTRSGRPDSILGALSSWGRLTGGALGIVVLALLGLLVGDQAVVRPRFDDALEATRVLRLSHEAMLDQQSGLRGYLLARNSEFLEAFERGKGSLEELTPKADELLTGGGRVGALYLELRLSQQAWLDTWGAQALELGRQGADIPAGFVRLDKTLFDAYRAVYEETVTELVARRDEAIDLDRSALLVTVGAALLIAVGAGAIGARRVRVLRRAVEEPIQDLLQRVRRIGDGDLEARPLTGGPVELRVLAQGLEDTATALGAANAAARDHAAELEARAVRQSAVLQLAREVAGSLSLRYVLRGVCTHAAAVAGGAEVIVWLLDEERSSLKPVADNAGPDLQPIGWDDQPMDDSPLGWAARHGRVRRGPDVDSNDGIAIPMIVGARVIGVLQFRGSEVSDLSEDALEMLETLAIHGATAIDAARLHEATSTLAMTDSLSGLPNRRSLDADLELECTTSARYGRPLAFLMVDIDHFKAYNDSFGHGAGDAALQHVAQILADGLRTSDVAYRYGGEEFALILRETTPHQAWAVAERLRSDVEHGFTGAAEPRAVTVSIGLSGMPEHGPTPEALVGAADAALYEAKRTGRNRVYGATTATSAGDDPQ